MIYIDHVYAPIAKTAREIPIMTYHLKFRLFKKMLFESSSSSLTVDKWIFLISKPFPARPMTSKAAATNEKV